MLSLRPNHNNIQHVMRTIKVIILIVIFCAVNNRGILLAVPINFYEYDRPGYPNIEVGSTFSSLSANVGSGAIITPDKFDRVFYDGTDDVTRSKKLAIEVDWSQVDEIDLQYERDGKQYTFYLFLKATDNYANLVTAPNTITTHFLHNRLAVFLSLLARTQYPADLTAQTSKPIEWMNQVLSNKAPLTLLVKYTGYQYAEKYRLISRSSGFTREFARYADLSFSAVSGNILNQLVLSIPFRLRASKPSESVGDFRWVGDVITFGPTFAANNTSTVATGIGAFVGIGLSEQGQMIGGITGGVLFGKNAYWGWSYNLVGLVQGIADLTRNKPAWGAD